MASLGRLVPRVQTASAELIYSNPLLRLSGLLVNSFLLGTLSIQIHIYRTCFPKDSVALKLLVYFVFAACVICDLLETLYLIGVSGGVFASFPQARYLWFASPFLGSIIAMLVQFVYCFRIVAIRQTAWPVAGLIGLISVAQGVAAMIWVILERAENLNLETKTLRILVYIWLVGSSVGDVLIAVTITALLRNASVLPQTRDVLKKIVRLVIETNTLTSLVAILSLLLFACTTTPASFLTSTMILPGIYANTLMVVLNQRAAM
ncbi:hypothetical protein B0H16DRAFT_1789362 [Mycena metata]|uniref:DUF6534 domain-containing protein n=1 Tax=Mycena metata TaxID=1033252 RepID=A0AAD7JLB9_9AGAR|nr:hypothetical protein B0H16DRAFT_1789362 [Mycena metata]